MKNLKRLTSALPALAVALSVGVSALAADGPGFSDVGAGAWYADAVAYVQEKGLMSGTGETTFSPEGSMSRAMLATVLYRRAGSPAGTGAAAFADALPGAWYTDAVAWAAGGGVMGGYGNGLFGVEDPVSREQLAAILWRGAHSPAPAGTGAAFADQADLSPFAADAVAWARERGVVSGKSGNRFDPQGGATRAEVAAILQNYLTLEPDGAQPPAGETGPVAVVYFSATGSTKAVAGTIAGTLGGALFEIVPEDPYTAADLNWNEPSSRVNAEHEDPSVRPAIAGGAVDLAAYDTVFLGYPIWWGEAPNILRTFLESAALSGKTVIPFCTSTSSGLGSSAETLRAYAPDAVWLAGRRFPGGAAEADVRAWVLGLDLQTAAPAGGTSRSLVVYFSLPETADPNHMTAEEANSTVVIGGEVLGNTQYMARIVQEAANADSFRIEPETPYTTDHEALVALASEERAAGARPALKGQIANFDDYDRVFVGYPIWWGDMPQILYSFFDAYELSGKTVVPFCTHGGSGFAGTPAAIRALEPDATVLDGLAVSRDSIQDARREIVDWVDGLAR